MGTLYFQPVGARSLTLFKNMNNLLYRLYQPVRVSPWAHLVQMGLFWDQPVEGVREQWLNFTPVLLLFHASNMILNFFYN